MGSKAEMKCEDCRFWEEKKRAKPGNGARMGYCRCRPPIATGCFVPKANPIAGSITPQLAEMTLWPQVSANNWCGEFESRILTKPVTKNETQTKMG